MTLELRSERLVLRAIRDSDAAALLSLMTEPGVAEWWPDYDAERVRAEYIHPDPDHTALVLEREGQLIGLIQFGEERDPQYRHASIDVLLGSAHWGKGLAAEAIRTLAEHVFENLGHHRIVIDPAVENSKAIRAYAKVGFRPVGTMRQYERAPDGRWRDGLLMELLAEDFRKKP
jgi:aminoglycoside 6'-N-acetyltransferase